jgi:hypothetical protein
MRARYIPPASRPPPQRLSARKAPVAELVDALDSKSSSARSAGSIPARGTRSALHLLDGTLSDGDRLFRHLSQGTQRPIVESRKPEVAQKFIDRVNTKFGLDLKAVSTTGIAPETSLRVVNKIAEIAPKAVIAEANKRVRVSDKKKNDADIKQAGQNAIKQLMMLHSWALPMFDWTERASTESSSSVAAGAAS